MSPVLAFFLGVAATFVVSAICTAIFLLVFERGRDRWDEHVESAVGLTEAEGPVETAERILRGEP